MESWWLHTMNYCRGSKIISLRNYFLILMLCTVVQQATCTTDKENDQGDIVKLTVNKKDMKITIGAQDSFSINSSEPVKQPTDVYLYSDDTHIATVTRMVTIETGKTGIDVNVRTVHLGSCIIVANYSTLPDNPQNASWEDLYVRIHVRRSSMLSLLTGVSRWFYEICWAVHLLPQVYLNYHLQSVVGLSFDYLALSSLSFLTFALYYMVYFWSTDVRIAYLNDQPPAPGVDLIDVQDVVFSILNIVIILGICIQCYRYERGDQKISLISKITFGIIVLLILILLIIVLASHEQLVNFITFVDVVSYLKLLVHFIKYIPQVYMNYSRKSTEGWSIGFVILDLLNAALTLLEMCLVATNYGHWISFIHSPTKLLLALISIGFATTFIIQHYVLYRLKLEDDTIPILGAEKGQNTTLQGSPGGDGDVVSPPGGGEEMKNLTQEK